MNENKCEVIGRLDHYSAMDLGNRVYSVSGLAPTCTSHAADTLAKILIGGGNKMNDETDEQEQYRIRKLTPLESFRLMGVDDADAEKMLEVNSNTQCYKQAGNSIVVDVMVKMFQKLFD